MRHCQFDIYLVQEQFYQSIFLSNLERKCLQFSSNDDTFPLSKQVSISNKNCIWCKQIGYLRLGAITEKSRENEHLTCVRDSCDLLEI